ncbi:MAG: 2-(hydroxymethyl)glutarate dehydrogenase [Candidatus Dichloromethanomonas elyunquensis]|nr:MAG: 2-(hydroxymethyl)glutarate dehydrogenase [Candidatus Dichloromethanomonas elyunquensis]
MKLGFIGVGKMGKPMAFNLRNAGHELTVCNRSKKAVDDLVMAGAIAADSPAQAGKDVEVVFLCLPTGKDVAAAVTGTDGILDSIAAGTLIIDHSTISPADSRRMSEACRDKGVGFLDAPVSGGVTGAEKGTLSIMVGGDYNDYILAEPLLRIIGKSIFYLGSSGSGNAMKLVNNLLVGITNAALAEAFILAVKNGLDAEQALDILTKSSGDSFVLKRNLPNFVLKNDFSPAFTLDMLNKDMALAEELALNQGVRLLLGSLAHQIGREAAYAGLGQEDMSAVVKVLERLTGVEIV